MVLGVSKPSNPVPGRNVLPGDETLFLSLLPHSLTTLSAQTLYFSSATVLTNNTVQLTISGPTNSTYYLERLNKTNPGV